MVDVPSGGDQITFAFRFRFGREVRHVFNKSPSDRDCSTADASALDAASTVCCSLSPFLVPVLVFVLVIVFVLVLVPQPDNN